LKYLLTIDAIINLALGAVLIIFPASVVDFLGVPQAVSSFYPSILGAVLFGIGIALIIEIYKTTGLGLLGAIAINLCGALTLAGWLSFGDLLLPLRGQIFLWSLVFVLVGISTIEWMISHNERDKT